MIEPSLDHEQPSAEREMRVLVADKSSEVRRMISKVLKLLGGFKIVSEANNGQEALELFSQFRPDVAIIAVALTDINGFEVLASIKRAMPACVVILTSRQQSPAVESAGALLGATSVCSVLEGPAQIRRALLTISGKS
jgi:chemotaxis response regulator CheB